MSRNDGRRPDQLRPVEIVPDYLEQPHGAVLYVQGKTRVLCTASVEESVPRWMSGRGVGLDHRRVLAAAGVDRAAHATRGVGREAEGPYGRDPAPDRPGRPRGHRLARRSASGRSGSTATCSRPTAARAAPRSAGPTSPPAGHSTGSGSRRRCRVRSAAVSLGIVAGELLLDLDYSEDSNADVDLNVVMTGDGRLVEVQATAEQVPFGRDQLDELLELAARGIGLIGGAQQDAIAAPRA